MKIVDSHVHFYSSLDLEHLGLKDFPYDLPEPYSLKEYLDGSGSVDVVLINNVDMSIINGSENVFRSFREFSDLQKQFPVKYSKIRLVGTIKANPDYATMERLLVPQVKGIRIVLHDAKPSEIGDKEFCTKQYLKMYQLLRSDQHLHIYAKRPETILKVLKQIPGDITTVIDHLGTSYLSEDHLFHHTQLLEEASDRKNVYFKGPGYRTSINPLDVVPIVSRIVEAVGRYNVVLGATDAPHVGMDPLGRSFLEEMGEGGIFEFLNVLSDEVSKICDVTTEELLFKNALKVLSM